MQQHMKLRKTTNAGWGAQFMNYHFNTTGVRWPESHERAFTSNFNNQANFPGKAQRHELIL